MSRRLFVAISLNEDMRQQISAVRQKVNGVRWIDPDNYHLTVCFIGNVEENALADIKIALQEISAEQVSFNLEFDKIIWAPPNRPPRMIWAQFKKNQSFTELSKEVHQRLSIPFGQEPIPHVTLARIKGAVKIKALAQPELSNNKLKVSSLQLMESELTPTGSVYKQIFKINLN